MWFALGQLGQLGVGHVLMVWNVSNELGSKPAQVGHTGVMCPFMHVCSLAAALEQLQTLNWEKTNVNGLNGF